MHTSTEGSARRARLATLLVASAVGALLTIAVSDQRFLTGESAVLEGVNALPRLVGAPLEAVMQLGTRWAGLAVAAIALVAFGWRRWATPAAVLVAMLTASWLSLLGKEVVERDRPAGLVDDLVVRDDVSGFGYPSSHAAVAFAVAAALVPALPRRWRPLVWALAAMVGLARLYVGVHWPADVVGGAVLGIAVGSAASLVMETIARAGRAVAVEQ